MYRIAWVILVGVALNLGWLGLTTVSAFGQGLQVWIRAVYVADLNTWLKDKVLEWADQQGVEVNVAVMSDYIFDDKFVTAIETGTLPDVAIAVQAGGAIAAENGLAVPLDDVVDQLGRDDFYPVALKPYTFEDPKTGQEHVYGIPLFFEYGFWYIRTDLLNQAGLEVPEDPTLEWLFETARALNQPPSVYGLGIPISPSFDSSNILTILLDHYGGGFISDLSPHGADVFNTPPTWNLFSDLKKLYADKVIPPDAVSWTDSGNNLAYMQGRIAITWNPGSIMAAMLSEGHPLAKVTKLLVIPPVNLAGQPVMVLKSQPERESLCKDLVKYIFSDKETLRRISSDEAGVYGVPPFKSQGNILSQKVLAGEFPFLEHDPMAPIARGEVAFGNNVPIPYGKPTSVYEGLVTTFQIPSMMAPLFLADADPQKVAEQIATYVNAELARIGGP